MTRNQLLAIAPLDDKMLGTGQKSVQKITIAIVGSKE